MAAALILACAAARAQHAVSDITPPGSAAAIRSVVVHPYDGERIVAISNEGVHLSVDGGITWGSPALPPERALNARLFADPARPGVVFLEQPARSFVPILGAPNVMGGRLYRSADFGRSWSLVAADESAPTEAFRAAVVMPTAADPRDPVHLYGTRRAPWACRHMCFGSDHESSLHESRDGGMTWGPPVAPFDGLAHISYPTPGAPERLFAVTSDWLPYLSVDAGRTWQRFVAGFSHTLFWVEQDRLDPKVLYAAGTVEGPAHAVARSDDGGATWRIIHRAPERAWEIPRLTIDPYRHKRLWLSGSSGGLQLSEDGGETWRALGFAVEDARRAVSGAVAGPADAPQVYFTAQEHLVRAMAGPTPREAVEYRQGDRYWLSGDRGEIASQDFRAYEAIRTGQRFGLWSRGDAPAGSKGLCRFQGDPSRGQHSRFLALEGFECDIVKALPAFVLEGEGEYFALPPGPEGSCAAGLVAVRRFNNLQPSVNHRYVADAAVAQAMHDAGWYDEGVRFCARPLGSHE